MNCAVLAALSSHSFYDEDILKYCTLPKYQLLPAQGTHWKYIWWCCCCSNWIKLKKRWNNWGCWHGSPETVQILIKFLRLFLEDRKLTFHPPPPPGKKSPFFIFLPESLLSPPGMGWVGGRWSLRTQRDSVLKEQASTVGSVRMSFAQGMCFMWREFCWLLGLNAGLLFCNRLYCFNNAACCVFMVLIIKCLFRFVVCFMQYEINVDTCACTGTHTLIHTQTQSMLANTHTHTLSLLVW